ncbi:MAG: MFS transporter [Thermotogae bacterium]|nr:MFS transporter [Thermotogota bacterium]MCL5032669.1 MFS transporter [Thermotogota bacterium]
MKSSYFHLYHLFSNNFSILSYLLTSAVNSIAAKWGLPFSTIGLINFAGALSYITTSLLFGRKGDRLGQKKLLIFATMIFGAFNVLGFFWSNITELFIFAIGLNFFFGTFFPQIEGLLSKREKQIGVDPAATINRFTLSWSAGNIIGMALGPFLIVRYPYITFGYGIILSFVASYILRRDFKKHGESINFRPVNNLKIPSKPIDFPKIGLYRKVYRLTLLLSGLIYSAVLSLFPKVISMNGLPIGLSGFLIVGANIGVLMTFLILGRFKIWVANPKISMIFMVVFPMTVFLIFMPISPLIFFLISLFAGMSYAVPYTYAIFYGLNSQDEDEGKQGGFHEAIIGMIFGVGPLLGSVAIQIANGLTGLGIMALGILSAIASVQIWFVRKIHEKQVIL